MEILNEFGIQPTLLLAQIVNFLIILFLLKRFFYKPITKMLDDRKKKIEESLKNADFIEEKLSQTEEKTAKILEEARKNAQDIVTAANKEAERLNQEAVAQSRKLVVDSLEKAQVQIENQKQQMQKQLEKETLSFVAEVVRKVLGKKLSSKEKQSFTTQALSEIEKQTQ